MLLWSLQQRGGRYKRARGWGGRENLLLSNSTNLAWRLLCRDLCDWARCLPLIGQGEDRGWGPSRSQSLVSPLPHTAAGDLQHFLSREGWELTVFMKGTWPRKASSTISFALERVLSCTSHHQVFKLLFVRAQLEPADRESSRRTATHLWHWPTTTDGFRFYIGNQRHAFLINYPK